MRNTRDPFDDIWEDEFWDDEDDELVEDGEDVIKLKSGGQWASGFLNHVQREGHVKRKDKSEVAMTDDPTRKSRRADNLSTLVRNPKLIMTNIEDLSTWNGGPASQFARTYGPSK